MIVPLSALYFRAVAEAHVALDPTAFLSAVPDVGVAFREKVFYPCLMSDPDSFVWMALFNGNLAGYLVGTKNTETFTDRLKKFSPLLLLGLAVKAAFRKPSLTIKYGVYLRRPKPTLTETISAEILSFGVLPEYRTPEFEKKAGHQIAVELFKKAVESFHRMGADQFKVMTVVENHAANRFYQKQGLRLADVVRPFGAPCHLYVHEA